MLKLNAAYSKKVPVEGQDYSSQSYHAQVEVEIPDGLSSEQLEHKIHATFELVRDSVEKELSQVFPAQPMFFNQALPALQAQQVAPPRSAPVPAYSGNKGTRRTDQPRKPADKASSKQLSYLQDIAGRQGMNRNELNDQAQQMFGINSVQDLSRLQASKMIEALKTQRIAA